MAQWLCILAIMCMIVLVEPGLRYSSRIVDTESGLLRGIIQSSHSPHLDPVEVFYGVPYASPPVDSLRFRATRAPPRWSGTRLADSPPPICPQRPPPIHPLNQSEDCLTLNILVPASGSRGIYAPYAVVVLVHGESFERNSGNGYDGRVLTSYGHVIFITVNYRLGILGFLKVSEEQAEEPGCCFAVSDLEAALQWVQGNIAAFGGDPTRVTLVGQDTGAALANFLLLRPSSRGLFQRVTLLSGSLMSPWAVQSQPLSQLETVTEQLGCRDVDHILPCLQGLPLSSLMGLELHDTKFLPQFGPWFTRTPASLVEGAGDTFINRQMLLGLTSHESYHDFLSNHIQKGLDLEEKDDIIRTFVNNAYSYHLKEIFAAVRNEYREWGGVDSLLSLRDSALAALSDGHTSSQLLRLAYLHSRRGATTYLFHLAHQADPSLNSLGLSSVRGDILPYILGLPLTNRLGNPQAMTVTHTVLRFFTNFAKTGDPNSPGAEPDYENDKGVSDVWDMFEPVKQVYLSVGVESRVQSHYRGHKMALWLNLVQQLQASEDDSDYDVYREYDDDVDHLFVGVVRPKTSSRLSTPAPPAAPRPAQDCIIWNSSTPSTPTLQLNDLLRLSGPWGLTVGVGCVLLLCNLLLFVFVCYKQWRADAQLGFQLQNFSYASHRLVAKSQSAPELATASFTCDAT